MRLVRIVILAATLAALTAGTALAGGGNSDAAHACQKGGYADLVGSGGETFSNVGECVSFAARGGTFGEPPPPPPPSGIVVPAGSTVTFDNPTLSACNQLSWGFTIDLGTVVLGGKPAGCLPTEIEPDSTFGPFDTTTTLRVFLIDHTCSNTTYYNDGDHGITTQSGPTSWDVDIADAGGGCNRQNIPAVFVPPGNLSVDVIVNP